MGERLGNFELKQQIGAGGMAHVWVAHPLDGTEKTVCVKRIAPEYRGDERMRELFRKEAKLAAPLSHANIVQVLQVAEHDGEPFLVMEWVDGLNLAQLRQKMWNHGETFSVQEAVYIVEEIARALVYAHGFEHKGNTGVVHRDISPQNVMISQSGEVKLTDFGIARAIRDHTTAGADTGKLPHGKVAYSAPEQMGVSQTREPTADLYSLGAILHELLSGKPFRDDLSVMQIVGQIMRDEIPPLDRDDVPDEIASLMRQLLDKAPRNRPRSADAVLDRIDAWSGKADCERALARLCRSHHSGKAPRSGITAAVPTPPPTDPAPVASGESTPDGVDTLPPTPVPAERPLTRKHLVPIVAGSATAGALAGVLGFATIQSLNADDTPEDVVEAKLEPSASPLAAPPTERAAPMQQAEAPDAEVAEPPADPAPRAEEEAEQAKPRAGEPAPQSKPHTSATKPKPKKPTAAKEKVLVKFRLDGPRTAWILIDGRREVILQPFVDAKLTAGKHRLQWKTLPDDPWKRGPTIKLEPGREYTLDVTDRGPVLR